jgi:hypothetical protein
MLIDRFFAASRLRDFTALSTIATTRFDPAEQGTVLSFEIDGITPTSADTKEVRLHASVRTPSGEVVTRPIAVVLRLVDGKWVVSAFSDMTGAPMSAPGR